MALTLLLGVSCDELAFCLLAGEAPHEEVGDPAGVIIADIKPASIR